MFNYSSHIKVDKVSNLSGNDNISTLNTSLKSLDPVLLDSLVVNNIVADKQDNIVQAKSLESQPESVVDVWNNNLAKPTRNDARDLQSKSDRFLGKLFCCFSWSRNLDYFAGSACSRGGCDYQEDVEVVGGLRVLSSLAIIAVHLAVFLMQVSSEYNL